MSRIKTPSLTEKCESRHCPLAALVEKYVSLVAASVCGMTVYQVTFSQVFLYVKSEKGKVMACSRNIRILFFQVKHSGESCI